MPDKIVEASTRVNKTLKGLENLSAPKLDGANLNNLVFFWRESRGLDV
tara:strand:- start:364 stop:507 length:144 start_codon:yes stop_codon:yes gene_type:complete